jgi:dihydroorotase
MSRLLLRGGHVCCPATDRDGAFDVLVDEQTILEVGAPGSLRADDAQQIDVDGCFVVPAAIDIGTFLRDPGREEEEPLEQLLAMAARGGYGTLATLPVTSPRVRGSELVERLLAASRGAPSTLAVLGDLTDGDDLADMGEMAAAGAAGFWAPLPRRSDALLRHALEYGSTFDKPAVLTPSGAEPCPPWVLLETPLATRLGLPARAAADEAIAVFRALELAELADAKVVIGPVASARSLTLIDDAVARGVQASAFCALLNLVLDEDEHDRRRYDTDLRLDPPLGTAADREALVSAVKAGRLLVASGHRPVSPRFKEVEMARAEPGAATLGSALGVLFSEEGVGLSPSELAQATAAGPALALGLKDRGRVAPGALAQLTVLDRSARTVIDGSALGRVHNHPLKGRTLPGGVRGLVAGATLHVPSDD